MIKIHLSGWWVAFIICVFTSCNTINEENLANDNRLLIVSSFSIISDIIQEIGGEKVLVYNLVPIGMAPHTYSPTPKDVKFAQNADIFFYNGLNLEGGKSGWVFKMIYALGFDTNKVFMACKDIPAMYLQDENNYKEVNPHAFISPRVGVQMAINIRDALVQSDKKDSVFYVVRAENYIRQLQNIEREYQEKLGSIPQKQRVFIASEQAFQYLANDYNLTEGYIWAIDTDKNGTPKQMMNIIDFIHQHTPHHLFVESNVDRRPMEAVSEATNIPIYQHPIYSDELGKPGQTADTYLKYLKYNLEQIYNGLTTDKTMYK
ncbi:MAG: zinc ABC transporter substrate-binding protein [Chitinophagales bacterium]|nr:zinc ABC transporter substrate-binding protein [Chitinophagales bacterium]